MIHLRKLSTLPPDNLNKNEALRETAECKKELSALQDVLYAQNKYSVLVVIQGMDASGKDGLIRNAFSTINPTGLRVYSWTKPTEEEAAHDFLWRIHKAVPRRRMIHVFNRSHYEDILVPTVYKTHPEKVVENRYRLINDFELLLKDSGTSVLKFYLHVSEEEQKQRLAERRTDRTKMWKHDVNDMQTMYHREAFLDCYQNIFKNCSEHAPWHIVPADKNWYKEYVVVKRLVSELKKLPLEYPTLKKDQK